jgi:hypothetical protein
VRYLFVALLSLCLSSPAMAVCHGHCPVRSAGATVVKATKKVVTAPVRIIRNRASR